MEPDNVARSRNEQLAPNRVVRLTWGQIGAIAAVVIPVVAGAGYEWATSKSEVSELKQKVVAYENRVVALAGRIETLERDLAVRNPTSIQPQSDRTKAPSQRTGSTDGELKVVFSKPRPNATVSQFTDVSFSVSGEIPEGYLPTLLVRDGIGQYWSFGPALNGEVSNVQIGIAEDQGKFEIGVLFTDDKTIQGKTPYMRRPRGLYSAINVFRK